VSSNIIDARRRFDKDTLVDIGFVILICGFLAAIQIGLSPPERARLSFDHESFVLWTLLTSAYIHHDFTHLLNNLIGFLIAAVAIYWLCWRLGERRWFRVTAVSFSVVLPILVNLTSYAVLEWMVPNASPTGRGFSGVAAGFVGFLFAAFIVWIAKQSSRRVALYIGQGIGVLMAWVLALIYRGLELQVIGLVGVGMGLSGWGLVSEVNSGRICARWREWLPQIGVGVTIVSLLLWFLIVLFPANFLSGTVTTNIFAHGAGFMWGTVSAFTVRKVI